MNWYRILQTASVYVVLCTLLFRALFFPAVASANTVLFRPHSITSSTSPLPILVQFTPSESDTETTLVVEVDPAWTVASNPATLTTSTSGLPSGTTAWPGMSTANTVTGQDISYPSSNLNTGVTYGFFITGGIGVNPSGPHSQPYLWQLHTFNGPTLIEDSREAAIPVQASSQIQISASVLPQATDLSVELATVGAVVGDIGPATTLNYQVTYENHYGSSTPITVQATWSLATVEGTSTPSIELLSYVPGSATDGYNSTPPVIDTVNRTITWTVANLPTASGPQTVDFSLVTANYDSAGKQLSFDVSASAVAPVSTVPSSVTQLYRNGTAPTPAPSPIATSTPTATAFPDASTAPAASPAPSASPQTSAPGLTIVSVSITNITDTTAEIQVVLSEPAALNIAYGLSAATSKQTLIAAEYKKNHTFLLSELLKNSHYIFQFTATTPSGNTVRSDFFTFRTALNGSSALPFQGARLTSEGVLIATLDAQSPSTLSIPAHSPLELALQLNEGTKVKSFILELQQTSQFSQGSFEQTVGREYISQFKPSRLGMMQLIIKLIDFDGSIISRPIAQLFIVEPLKIVDQQGLPIEFASIFVRKYNPSTRLFEAIPGNSILKNNPVKSDVFGIVPLILPVGTYQLDVSAPGYRSLEVPFVLTSESTYPTIALEPEAFPILGKLKNIVYVSNELLELQLAQLKGTTISPTIYMIATFLTSSFFLFLATVALAAKTHISIWLLPNYIVSHSRLLVGLRGERARVLRGQLISSDTKKPVSRAAITLQDAVTEEVLATIATDSRGYFHWQSSSIHPLKGTATAVGFASYQIDLTNESLEKPFVFELEENPSLAEAKLHRLRLLMESMLGSMFEALLVLALLLQVFFFSHINIYMASILIAGSMVNLAVWSVFQATPHQHRHL